MVFHGGAGQSGGTEVARFYATLGLNSSGYTSGLSSAVRAGLGFGTGIGGVILGVRALEGVLIGSVRSVISYETAFSNVAKTVNMIPTDLAVLNRALRDMSLVIPVSRNELASIAAVAGQLGIQGVQDILKFTDTAARSAVAMNIPVQDVALSLARLSNLLGRPIKDVDKLASTVALLGDNTEASEREIFEFANRMAGAAKLVGISDTGVLALSARLASLGIEAEAGGSAMQRAFITINESVIEGKKNLELLGLVTGMSAKDFKQLWEKDATEAFFRFVEGVGASGDDATKVLDQLELSDIRVLRSLLALGQHSGQLRADFAGANAEINTTNKLMAETARAFGTTESQITMFKNRIVEASDSIGTGLVNAINKALPVVNELMDALGRMNQLGGAGKNGRSGLFSEFLQDISGINAVEGIKGLMDDATHGFQGFMADRFLDEATRKRAAQIGSDRHLLEAAKAAGSGMPPEEAFALWQGQQAAKATGGNTTPKPDLSGFDFGDGGGHKAKSRAESALEAMEQALLQQLIDAWVKGGDAQVAIVRAQQQDMLAEWQVARARFAALGAEIPEEFFDTFMRNWVEQHTKAEQAMKEYLSAQERIQNDFMHEQIKAYLDGGDAGVKATKSAQQGLINEASALTDKVMASLGLSFTDVGKRAVILGDVLDSLKDQTAKAGMGIEGDLLRFLLARNPDKLLATGANGNTGPALVAAGGDKHVTIHGDVNIRMDSSSAPTSMDAIADEIRTSVGAI